MSKIDTLMRPIGKIFGFDQKLPKPPKPPSVDSKDVRERTDKERRALMARQGYAQTQLTQPGEITGSEPIQHKTLLG